MASRLELSLTWVGSGSEGATHAVEDGGEVGIPGNLLHSLEGGIKPALAPALTCRLFLSKDALDTVIWTVEVRWWSSLLVSPGEGSAGAGKR